MTGILTARAPAKLIISGEHAVVYGNPAIAVAVNKYTETEVSINPQDTFIFRLLNLESVTSSTIQTLKRIRTRLVKDYYNFLNGNCSIKDVLKMPFELLQFSISNFFEKLNIQLPHGLDIKVNSAIPMGCGMGSSAAAVISTLYAVMKLLGLNIDPSKFLLMGVDAENLQHGKSSGLDLHLATFGGCKRFMQGNTVDLPVPNFSMYMINTGTPKVSTGECVTFVKDKFKDQQLLEEFFLTTTMIQEAWQSNNLNVFKAGIKRNHQLLNLIGVVPKRVNDFIKQLEMHNCVAKICGAGSISGDTGGIVLAIGEKEHLLKISAQYNYQLEEVVIDTKGAHVI